MKVFRKTFASENEHFLRDARNSCLVRLVLTSDLHFPPEITRLTPLRDPCGYTDQFYDALPRMVGRVGATKRVDAFVVCGDVYWDWRYFYKFPRVPRNWDWYNAPLRQLVALRSWLDPKVPLVLVEGNHDLWFRHLEEDGDGRTWVVSEKYRRFLVETYRLTWEQAGAVLECLAPGDWEDAVLVEETYLLRERALALGDGVLLYGYPCYDDRFPTEPWTQFRARAARNYREVLNDAFESGDASPPAKVLVASHRHPKPVNLYRDFEDPRVDLLAVYWGHYHKVSAAQLRRYSSRGPYECVMPEVNGFKFVEVT